MEGLTVLLESWLKGWELLKVHLLILFVLYDGDIASLPSNLNRDNLALEKPFGPRISSALYLEP